MRKCQYFGHLCRAEICFNNYGWGSGRNGEEGTAEEIMDWGRAIIDVDVPGGVQRSDGRHAIVRNMTSDVPRGAAISR